MFKYCLCISIPTLKGERMNFFRRFSANSGNNTKNTDHNEVEGAEEYAGKAIIPSASSRFPEYRSEIETERIRKEAQHMLRRK